MTLLLYKIEKGKKGEDIQNKRQRYSSVGSKLKVRLGEGLDFSNPWQAKKVKVMKGGGAKPTPVPTPMRYMYLHLLPVYVLAVCIFRQKKKKKQHPVASHKTTIECFSSRGNQSLTMCTDSSLSRRISFGQSWIRLDHDGTRLEAE